MPTHPFTAWFHSGQYQGTCRSSELDITDFDFRMNRDTFKLSCRGRPEDLHHSNIFSQLFNSAEGTIVTSGVAANRD